MINRITIPMQVIGGIFMFAGFFLFYCFVPRVFTGNTDLDNVFLGSVVTAVAGSFLCRRKNYLQVYSSPQSPERRQMAIQSPLDCFPRRVLQRNAEPRVKALPRAPQEYSLRLVHSRSFSRELSAR